MAYKIQHMSHNECVIEYEESKPKRDKPIVNFTIVTGGLIALVLGFNLVLILATIIVISFWRDLTRPRRRGFLIEFNR